MQYHLRSGSNLQDGMYLMPHSRRIPPPPIAPKWQCKKGQFQSLLSPIPSACSAREARKWTPIRRFSIKLNLGWTTVTSPISGIAGVSKVGIGDLMTPATVMTTISNVDPIYVDFSVAEQDYMRFSRDKSGHQVARRSLQLILGDSTVFPQRGRALLVKREVDARTGTIQVRAEFPNPGNVLRPGQYARIRAVTDLRKGALLIPQQAVSELQGVYQVGVVGSDSKVTIKTVKLGPQSGDMWWSKPDFSWART